jgi:hypothetical protein
MGAARLEKSDPIGSIFSGAMVLFELLICMLGKQLGFFEGLLRSGVRMARVEGFWSKACRSRAVRRRGRPVRPRGYEMSGAQPMGPRHLVSRRFLHMLDAQEQDWSPLRFELQPELLAHRR